MAEKEKNQTYNMEDIANIVAAAVKAATAPNELEQLQLEEKRRALLAEQERKEQVRQMQEMAAQTMATERENKRYNQQNCTHHRKDGTCRAVFVEDPIGGYMMCQKCHVIIRRGTAPNGYEGDHVYDTGLFNRLFQMSAAAGIQD